MNTASIKRSNERQMPWYLLGAFFLPVFLMYLIHIGMEIWPFGANSVLVLDLNGQYVYYFEYFRDIIHGDASLLYSWSRSLGGEFLGIFAYYLCSPFTLIVALLPKTVMTESLLLMILGKIGTCGVTMAYYLKKSRKTSAYTSVLFGTMYALCAYGVIQSMNTMWIDAMYLLPIVLLGLEGIIKENKSPLFYVVPLFVLLMTNYYIGFMTCIFLVLYFFYYFFSQDKLSGGKFVKAGLRFALYSLLAAAIAAIILIPAYYGLTFGKTTFQNTNYDFKQRFDFLDLFTKFLPASYDTVRPEGLPVVYSGMLTLLFAPLFFIAPGIKSREKVWSGVLCVALIMSMNASTVDIFWHGLSKPNWLNYRYSFMLCFFLIMLAARAFERFEAKRSDAFADKEKEDPPLCTSRIAYKTLLAIGLFLFAMIVTVQKQDYEYIDDLICIWVSLAFLGAYLICLHPISSGAAKTVGKTFLIILCAGELFVSGLSDMVALDDDVVFSNRMPYANFMARLRTVTEELADMDTGFYRAEKTVHRKVNDNMALGLRGISHSTSDLNASVIKHLGQLGYASRSHWTKYLGGTPVSDSLVGIKYVIAEESPSSLYKEIKAYPEKELFLYENPYAMGILNTISADVLDYDPEATTTPFVRLNELVTLMLGETETVELFKPIKDIDTAYENCDFGFTSDHKKYTPEYESKEASITYTVTAPTEDDLYVYFPATWAREVDLTLNGEEFGTYFGNETRRIVALGTFEADEDFTLTLTLTEDELYIGTGVDYFWYLDKEVAEEILPRLAAGAVQITDWDNTHIEGTVTTDAEHTLIYTSIPYDEGWKVTLDGKEAKITRVCDSLIAIDASAFGEGEHTISLRYMPDCYVYAFFITVGGVVLFLLCLIIRSLWRRMTARASSLALESVAPGTQNADGDLAALLLGEGDDDTVCDPLAILFAEALTPDALTPAQKEEEASEPILPTDEIVIDDIPEDEIPLDDIPAALEEVITEEEAEEVLNSLLSEEDA